MVGIQGRSKTCKTCKARRIACSLERPACKTCIKSSRECGGYQDSAIFILDHRTKSTMDLAAPTKKTRKHAEHRESSTSIPMLATLNVKHPSNVERTVATANAYRSLWSITSPSTRAVYRSQILSEFLCNYPAESSDARAGNWLKILPSHPTFTTALEATILAVCTAKLGRMHNDPSLVHESLKFYVQGLWELQKALWDERQMYRDETVAASMCLVVYEVLECPDQNVLGLVGHLKGCARLFELKGPKAFGSPFAHSLFLSFRQIEIQQAIAEKRSTFLSAAEWLKAPWKHHLKPISHLMLDLLAEATTITGDAYKILGVTTLYSQPEVLQVELLCIVKQCWKLDIRLRAFWKRFKDTADGSLYWPEMSNSCTGIVEAPESPAVFPIAFGFRSLSTANTCMLFWATSSILYSGLRTLYSLLGPFNLPPGPWVKEHDVTSLGIHLGQLPPLEHRIDVTLLAKNICQSVEYCMQPKWGPMSPATAVFPLKVALEILYEDPTCVRELEWAQAAMFSISDRAGIKVMNHLGQPITNRAFTPASSEGVKNLTDDIRSKVAAGNSGTP